MLFTIIDKLDSERISPKEFLEWAKKDLKEKDKHAIGNSLGNIKKAIHCRIDEIIERCHIKYTKDWNPKADTSKKLEALELLGITTSHSIVKLLTEIRNIYEHQYLLVTHDKVSAYYDIAEMWIENSYNKFSFNRIAITGFKDTDIKEFKVNVNSEKRKITYEIEKIDNFDYIWLSKKEIHEFKNGKFNIIKMDSIDWKKMAKYEASKIKFNSNTKITEHLLTASELTSIYKKALKFIKNKDEQ